MPVEHQTVRIFIAYSHKDRAFLDELRVHAAPLTRNQRLQIWFDGEIRPGEVWDSSIKENLHAARIILLLLSAHALNSDYFYEKEVGEALERHADGRARVVPVLLLREYLTAGPRYVPFLEMLGRVYEEKGDVIHMEVGEPDFPTPAPIVEAGIAACASRSSLVNSAPPSP